jgi:hypothetical protein
LRPKIVLFLLLSFAGAAAHAQADEDELGAWYMYMWSAPPAERRFGFQGDVQYRNWDGLGDLEQLLLRGGATWSPGEGRNTYTLGYAHVTSGAYGAGGARTDEHRLYQEALLPRRLGERVYLTHRLRLEQRWVEAQDFRNRFRYFFGLNYPFNRQTLGEGAVYLSFYNELFVNLERHIGDGRTVDAFDRNRAYLALGYGVSSSMRLQLGYMFQKTETIGKGQLQFNLLHSF